MVLLLASPKGEKLSYPIIHELHACTLQYTRLIPDSERTILVLGHVLSCSLAAAALSLIFSSVRKTRFFRDGGST